MRRALGGIVRLGSSLLAQTSTQSAVFQAEQVRLNVNNSYKKSSSGSNIIGQQPIVPHHLPVLQLPVLNAARNQCQWFATNSHDIFNVVRDLSSF
jgi:hypothetical protein